MTEKTTKTWRKVSISLVRERAPEAFAKIVHSPNDAAAMFRLAIGDHPQEHFCALYVNNRHVPIGLNVVAVGDRASCTITPAIVFGPACALFASAVVLCHNHPSGDPTPSPEDRILTNRMVAAGELLGIPVLDHLVLGHGRYFRISDDREVCDGKVPS